MKPHHSTAGIFIPETLVADESKDIVTFVCDLIDRFNADVRQKLSQRLGQA
jgi:hypothetical protein